jgi:NUMOD3 motif
MKPRISLREALSDPNLLGSALAGDSWKAWRTLLIAVMGEELTAEFLAVVGRRGGKSRALATFAAKAKISAALMGNKHTFGYKPTPDTRAKLSAALMGNKNNRNSKARHVHH